MPDNTTPDSHARKTAEQRERVRAASRKYYAKNRAKVAAREKAYHARPEVRARHKSLQEKYRARPEYNLRSRKQKNARLASLAGRPRPKCCEVCGRTGIIHFDHCHQRNVFRGWLCVGCNSALGHVNDDPNILRKLISYLERTAKLVPPQLTLPGI